MLAISTTPLDCQGTEHADTYSIDSVNGINVVYDLQYFIRLKMTRLMACTSKLNIKSVFANVNSCKYFNTFWHYKNRTYKYLFYIILESMGEITVGLGEGSSPPRIFFRLLQNLRLAPPPVWKRSVNYVLSDVNHRRLYYWGFLRL